MRHSTTCDFLLDEEKLFGWPGAGANLRITKRAQFIDCTFKDAPEFSWGARADLQPT
ncbi:MAG: hypothetical protein KBC32_01330 [Candidatus Didemnitutus sp.]|nr:hypothetical protein [Candidatus Didemnitutus sp.]